MQINDVQVALSTSYDRAAVVDLAIAVERLGYGGLWLTEAVGRDAFSLLTEIALKTSRIELGTGIVNHYSRGPIALAQAAASLSEVLDGRTFNLGLGASSRAVIEGFHGLAFDRPYARMAETLQLIRLALAGERLEFNGQVFRTARFSLNLKPTGPVRLYVAGFARPMLDVTGRYADGWLPNLPSLQGFAALRADVAAAATSADRSMPTIAAYLYTMTGEDPAEAEEPLRRTISWYLASGGAGYRNLFRRYGYGRLVDDIATLWKQGQRDEARGLVDSNVVRDVCLVGPTSSVPEQLGQFAAIGINMPVIRFPDPLPPDRQAAMLREIATVLAQPGHR